MNSRASNWPTAVFNAMEAFEDDFRCITMDQRNANGGESTPELHAHLVAALPRGGFGVESRGDAARNPMSHHLLVGGVETRDSFVHLGDAPGFGVEHDWDYARRHAA